MLIAAASLSTFLNIISILLKLKRKRKFDAVLDFGLLVGVFLVLNGSQLMLLIGIFSSLGISIYLWFSKPTLKDFV